MENQITVNSYDNYNAPVDNVNIAYLEVPHMEICKCFQITPGIWITPHSINSQGSYPANYIKIYNRYLKSISRYFQRLSDFHIGRSLLTLFSRVSPYKYHKEFYANKEDEIKKLSLTKPIFIVDKAKNRIGSPNLVILVVQTEDNQVQAVNPNTQEIIFVKFGSNHIMKCYSKSKQRSFFIDPMIPLFHELIHCLHSIYNYPSRNAHLLTIGKEKYNVLELLAYGSQQDLAMLKSCIASLNKNFLIQIQNIVHNLNKLKLPEILREFCAKQYFIENNGKEYKMNDIGSTKLINLLQNTFTEMALTKASKGFECSGYYDRVDARVYPFNPFNERFYSLQNGLHQEEFSKYIEENQIQPFKYREPEQLSF